jgi:pimeloyl-ACP methyl ester carboxylesterase
MHIASHALASKCRGILASVGLAASVLLLGVSASTWTVKTYLHAQRLVDVGGGRRLNIYCSGRGSPTVILVAGVGETLIDWRLVQPRLAERTRVCSYDEAGMGFSDPAPLPRDANAWLSDFHRLLLRAGIAPPYVLVGHSLGGLYVRLYADRYPRDVVGLVLVDPAVEYQWAQFEKAWPGFAKGFHQENELINRCSREANEGELHPGTRAYRDCITPPYGISDRALIAINAKQWERPGTELDGASEWNAIGTSSSNEVREAQRNYGSLPLIVLTAGPPRFTSHGVSLKHEYTLWRAWDEMHDRVAALSSRGENIVVRNSGHFIQIDSPSAVIKSVYKVIEESRSASRQ